MASPVRLFGFEIKRQDDGKDVPESVVSPAMDDGAININSGAHYGIYVDLDGSYRSEVDLLSKYRTMSMQPEMENAIDDIVNEAIVHDEHGKTVDIVLDDLKTTDDIKKLIREEFNNVLRLLDFNKFGAEIFRRWYIDGRGYWNVVIDPEDPRNGIQQLIFIDPRRIRKIRNITKEKNADGVEVIKKIEVFYLYNEKIVNNNIQTPQIIGNFAGGVKLSQDSVIHLTSGLFDPAKSTVLSYLHKAIRPMNQLRFIEDATVIYKVSRAPERRVFYVDTGNMPRAKAEQYLKDIMTKFRNKVVYDSGTGEIRDDRKHMCLAMDTRVPLLDGRELTISQIETELGEGKQLWAYSCDRQTGQFTPGLISWAGVARQNTNAMRLTLDNGETITCTPDHRFPVWGKGMIAAQDIQPGESMMPLKTEAIHVVSIEQLDTLMDMGCLTIENEHHTFALSAGIYTENSMLEDFWMPRRTGDKSTEITTLPAGQGFDNMDAVLYFEKKLYRALGVPVSRLETNSGFNIGRPAEISRDELKFDKFIQKLRNRFSILFDELLQRQLTLKGVCTLDEWAEFKQSIHYRYIKDNNFTELKEAELLQNRINTLTLMQPFIGQYFSKKWVQLNVLLLDEHEIDEMEKQMDKEADQLEKESADMAGGAPPGPPPPPGPQSAQGGQGAAEPQPTDNPGELNKRVSNQLV